MGLEFAHDPLERLLKLELLQDHLHPETDRKEPFGDQLGRLGRGRNPSAWRTIAAGAITVTDMPVAHQAHLPLNLLTLLRQARFGSNFAAVRASALFLSQGVMGSFLG